ncbi:MAG: hypothetical protein IMZ43_09830 [Thermoplasmata archaeon]|nr:hypothetical protein [Thermoplasmata archaeon]
MKSRLNDLFTNPSITIKKDRPILFLSDLHMGGGGPADNFVQNEKIVLDNINLYVKEGFLIVITGDGEELWQFTKKEIDKAHQDIITLFAQLKGMGRLIELEGNHNKGIGLPESLLIDGENPILVIHGHQGDFINDKWWRVGRFFTRYIWKYIEVLGIKDPTSASKNLKKHDLVRKMHNEWANRLEIPLVYGHTHFQEQCGYAWNVGGGITPGRVDIIELNDKGLRLSAWR